MLSFNSQNYVVEYKKATPQQWRGEAAKDNRLERVFGIFREPDEVNAIGSAMDLVSNLYSGQCEKDYDRRQIMFFNEYGELDGVFYDFCATLENEWTEQPEEDITQSWWVDNKEDVLSFDKREHFALGNGLKIPVPDGYHYDQCGTGFNMGWSYIVPCDVSLGENHIDAQPYSFGITSDPVSHAPFESKHIEAFKQVFISGGLLDEDVLVDTFTVSDHCAFLYQNWYDSAANLYNKINGFLLAGNDVYQFHIYANHTEPISQDEDTIAAFLEVGRAWMRQVVLNEDQEETTYTAPTTFSATADSDFEMDDDEGKLTNYVGTVSDVVIPRGVKIVGENAFLMKEITSVVIPEGVTELEDSAFWGCKKLNSVQLPSTLEKIGPDAFRGCESLTSIVIPEGVREIESDAFSFCTSLKNIYLPDSLWNIGLDAFSTFCDDMVLHVPQYSEAETYAQDNDLKYDRKKPPKTTAKKKTTKKSTTETVETVPDSAPQEPVEPFQLTSKGKTLDKYMGKDTNVVVPEGITTIAGFAFDSTSVKTVVLPNTVKKIGNYAFSDCSKLTQINIPSSVTSIEDCAFNKCSSLKEIVFPGSVKKLPDRVCDYCNALTKVVVEEGITEIKASAFSFCENLTDIFLPMSLTKIGDHLLLCSGKPTMHVYSGSYAEKYAQENELPVEIVLTPEQEAEKQRQEEARRIAEEKYAAELKAWEQTCGEIRAQREQRVSELLEEKRVELKKEAQSNYDVAVTAANKRKEAAQQKKSDAEKRLSTLGIFKFAEKKEANAIIQAAEGEIQTAESALIAAKQSLDKELAAIPAKINAQKNAIAWDVEKEYPLPTKPVK